MVRKRSQAAEARIEKRRIGWHLFRFAMLALLCTLCGSVPLFGQASSPSARKTGRISGVRRVLRGTFLCTTRYTRIHDFDVYFSLRTGQGAYCVDYETPVLDEIQDLASSEGKDIEISLDAKRNKVTLYTPQNRKLKARIVRADRCESPALAYSTPH